jgi:hypothetical protein
VSVPCGGPFFLFSGHTQSPSSQTKPSNKHNAPQKISQYLACRINTSLSTSLHITITSLGRHCTVLSLRCGLCPPIFYFPGSSVVISSPSRETNKLNNRTQYHITISTHHMRPSHHPPCRLLWLRLLVWFVLCPGRGIVIPRSSHLIPSTLKPQHLQADPVFIPSLRTRTPVVGAGHCDWLCTAWLVPWVVLVVS